MPDVLNNIFVTLLTGSTVSSAIVWFARSWISERIQNSIRCEYEKNLELYKTELKLESDRSLSQYNFVYKETLEAISGVYSRLWTLRNCVEVYVSLWGDLKEGRAASRQEVVKAWDDFSRFYGPRRIFLSKPLIAKLEPFRKNLYDIMVRFMIHVESPDMPQNLNTENRRVWTDVNDEMQKTVPVLMEDIENEFRSLLGTKSS